MRPYSMDLRERVAAAVDDSEGSQREVARLFRVSLSFISWLMRRRREAGTLAPEPHGGGPHPGAGPGRPAAAGEPDPGAQRRHPGAVAAAGRLPVQPATIWRAMRRRQLTRKKKTRHADERDRPDVQRDRRSFRRRVKRIEAERIVFVDETGVTTAMTPAYAWAPRGERAVGSAPGSWETVTVIAALGLGGVRAPLALSGAIDAVAFQSYVEQAVVPELHARDVVIFDNLKPHLGSGVAEAIKRVGARAMPLPPYSPDYTSIEGMFSKVKAYLRRVAARTTCGLYDALGEALRRVTVQDIIG